MKMPLRLLHVPVRVVVTKVTSKKTSTHTKVQGQVLLVGESSYSEISIEIPQRTENELPSEPVTPVLGYAWRNVITPQGVCTSMSAKGFPRTKLWEPQKERRHGDFGGQRMELEITIENQIQKETKHILSPREIINSMNIESRKTFMS